MVVLSIRFATAEYTRPADDRIRLARSVCILFWGSVLDGVKIKD